MHFPVLPFHRKKKISGTRHVSSLSHVPAIEWRAAGHSEPKKNMETQCTLKYIISSQSPATQPSCICMSFQHRIPDLKAISFSIFQRSNNACKDVHTCSRYRPCGEVHLPICHGLESSVSKANHASIGIGHLHLSCYVAHRVCTTLAAMAKIRKKGTTETYSDFSEIQRMTLSYSFCIFVILRSCLSCPWRLSGRYWPKACWASSIWPASACRFSSPRSASSWDPECQHHAQAETYGIIWKAHQSSGGTGSFSPASRPWPGRGKMMALESYPRYPKFLSEPKHSGRYFWPYWLLGRHETWL